MVRSPLQDCLLGFCKGGHSIPIGEEEGVGFSIATVLYEGYGALDLNFKNTKDEKAIHLKILIQHHLFFFLFFFSLLIKRTNN